jgi:hypothetical protein
LPQFYKDTLSAVKKLTAFSLKKIFFVFKGTKSKSEIKTGTGNVYYTSKSKLMLMGETNQN